MLLTVLALALAQPPTLLVVTLRPEIGVTAGVANLLTEAVVDEMRASGMFSRVAGLREVEALAQMEQQKQLMNCSTDGCMAELAGALGVDEVLMGSVGKIGNTFIIALRLVEARTAKVLASLSHHVCEGSEERALNAIRPLAHHLLVTAKVLPSDATPFTPITTCGQEPSTLTTTTEARKPARLPFFATGGALLVGGAVLGALTLFAALATAAAWTTPRVTYVDIDGLNVAQRALLWNTAAILCGAVALVLGALTTGMLVAGAGVGGAGAVLGE